MRHCRRYEKNTCYEIAFDINFFAVVFPVDLPVGHSLLFFVFVHILWAEERSTLRSTLQDDYNDHRKRKVDATIAKARYKAEAAADKSMVVATSDLQSVLPSPKHNASAVYYKRELSTYNLTIYSLADHVCSCFMWHEGTAGRGNSNIAYWVLKFLTKLPAGTKRVDLFSDTCSGQNRNKFFCAMILYFFT